VVVVEVSCRRGGDGGGGVPCIGRARNRLGEGDLEVLVGFDWGEGTTVPWTIVVEVVDGLQIAGGPDTVMHWLDRRRLGACAKAWVPLRRVWME